MDKINATTLKSQCLALLDEVHLGGREILITKRGKIVARLVPEYDQNESPWIKLRGKGRFLKEDLGPVLTDSELKKMGY